MGLAELNAALSTRMDGLAEFLRKDGRDVFSEQAHLETGSRERAYWHYGYYVALKDVMAKINAIDAPPLQEDGR